MGPWRVPADVLVPLTLVVGDEELLVGRAVSEVVRAARAADPDVAVRDLMAGEVERGDLDDALSPSLFGERRAVVLSNGQDAGKDLAAALLCYAADPAEEVVLVVRHSGANKGRALADGLRAAGAAVALCAKVTRSQDRLAFVRAEITRHGGRVAEDAAESILEAVGHDLRELASACGQLVADTGGAVDVAAVTRYHRGRAEVTGFTRYGIDGEMLSIVDRGGISNQLVSRVERNPALVGTKRRVASEREVLVARGRRDGRTVTTLKHRSVTVRLPARGSQRMQVAAVDAAAHVGRWSRTVTLKAGHVPPKPPLAPAASDVTETAAALDGHHERGQQPRHDHWPAG